MNRILLFLFFVFIQVNELLASPGGKIVRDFFDSPMGKVISVVLAIVFFPIIIRSWYKRKKTVSAAKMKLVKLSKIDNDIFDEINLKNRVTDIFTRVHKAWSEGNLDDCDEFMTIWYRQNQQTVFLDEWESKGLMNICTIRELKSIEPIHLRITEKEQFEGSRLMYAIEANMEDYLVSIEDSSVLEGKKGFKSVETVWTIQLVNGVWKVDNIEQSDMVSDYMKMESELSDSLIDKMLEGKTS